jgi:hypothetical protein
MPIRTASSTPGDRGIQLRHRIDDVETRPHRTLGLVLMGARVAEIDEDAVAHVLRDKAVIAPDRRAAPALIRRDHIAQIFGVHRGGERSRSHQVAKHHGQLTALGLRRGRDRGRVELAGHRVNTSLTVLAHRRRFIQILLGTARVKLQGSACAPQKSGILGPRFTQDPDRSPRKVCRGV